MKQPSVADMRTAADLLIEKGIPHRSARPPLCKLLWLCGIPIRPHVYISPLKFFLFYALYMSITWGTLMRIISWDSWTLKNILVSLAFGLITSSLNTYFYYRSLKKLDLPEWHDLIQEAQEMNQVKAKKL